jgi:SRSO17 transposase
MRTGPANAGLLPGLLMPCERKSVEHMAAVTAPDRTAAVHQSLLHFVGRSPWSDEKTLTKASEMAPPPIESHGPIEAWIIDDAGFSKKGEHSVGMARQYCGQLSKRENCQWRRRCHSPITARALASRSTERVGAQPRTSAQGGRPR